MWKREKHWDFDHWLAEERTGLSRVLKERFKNIIGRELLIRSGQEERTFDDVLSAMDDNIRLLIELNIVFREAAVPDEHVLLKTWECLESKAFGELPFVKISSHIFAAFARRARQGQRAPSKHPFNDVDAIASYLPLCDAMFVDNEMQALLKEPPLRTALDYGGCIFSLRTKDEFLRYLDNIESSASPEHLAKVREVYGDNWSEPYVGVIRDMRDS